MNKKREQTKRLLLALPVLTVPFVAIMFYLMGGGQRVSAEDQVIDPTGINARVPGASVDDRDMDKLALYEQVTRDSLRYLEQMKSDPYYVFSAAEEPEDDYVTDSITNPYLGGPDDLVYSPYQDPNEAMILKKLDKLNKALSQEETNVPELSSPPEWEPSDAGSGISKDIRQLEQMMQAMKGGEADPEMEGLNAVLEHILDLQHPERVRQRLRKESEENKGQVYSVTEYEKSVPVTHLSEQDYGTGYHKGRSNQFYGLESDRSLNADQPSVEAVVHEAQTVTTGSTVKLRLLHDVFINGWQIPRDNFVYGVASLRGERLEIQINSIRHLNSLFPVQLAVYDLDGLPGIRIPGAITRDVAKQSGDQTIQGLSGIGTYNPSLGAQAASAGIELGRNLLSRKIKLIKVDLKAGYKVLLKDNKRKDQ